MRPVLVIPGVLLALLGVVWVLQGANLLTGSAMSGSAFWLVTGVAVWIVGVVLLVVGLARGAPRPATGAG